MEVRLILSVLLLLAYASGACSKTTRHGPIAPPRFRQYHRHQHQQHRQARALSEFLLPPPAPANFHVPHNQNQHNSHNELASTLSVPITAAQEWRTRNGRYVNEQTGDGNNNFGYFSKLMNWLNPFTGKAHRNHDAIHGKDIQGQGLSGNLLQQQQFAQYAPYQPYTSEIKQYESPPLTANSQTKYANTVDWYSGKPCNPCNQVPWMPIFRDSLHYNPGQYAPNAGSNMYLPPSSQQEITTIGFLYSEPTESALNYQPNNPLPNPFLHPDIIPPLFKAKPFNDHPEENLPPNSELSITLNNDYKTQAENLHHLHPQNLDHSLANSQPDLSSANLNYHNVANLDDLPPNFYQQPPSNFNDESTENIDHSPPAPNINHLPAQHTDNAYFQNFNYPLSDNSNYSPVNVNEQLPQNFDIQLSSSLDHQVSPNLDWESQQPQNLNNQIPLHYDDQHSTSTFEQHHEPSQIVGIIKEPPTNIKNINANDNRHEESYPVPVNGDGSNILNDSFVNETLQRLSHHSSHYPQSIITSSEVEEQHVKNSETLHFQRSPLIDLSVAGESSTKTPNLRLSKEWSNYLKNKPSADPIMIAPLKEKHIIANREFSTPTSIVIDYILSSPEQTLDLNESEKQTGLSPRPQHHSERTVMTSSVSPTTSTTTAMPLNQQQQETLIESVVQSYEFFKTKNDMSTKKKEEKIIKDTDEFSASKEVTIPNKFGNENKNKQVIQIIIPYTSQYTPSPFHSTRSIDEQKKGNAQNSHNSSVTVQSGETAGRIVSLDNNVEDNVVILESRRVSVTQNPPERKLRNNRTDGTENKIGHTIDVHRLQKNIDNWTIQEYAKRVPPFINYLNSTHPRWISSKQIPDEYLLPITELEDNEYYDLSNETDFQRGTNKSKHSVAAENITKVSIISATYPKNSNKPEDVWGRNITSSESSESERVYVVTPVPNPNFLEKISLSKDSARFRNRNPKAKHEDSAEVEQAYQVLPQAVNNLAVLSSVPESAAPALWGIMEHEELAANVNQPRWRSESDVLPDPASTPILYAGHSKVSRAR